MTDVKHCSLVFDIQEPGHKAPTARDLDVKH
jgi:hypothetical protein